ncbi:MAG: hypothetical protein B9S32_00290 [Verrucomicrobia bacterium Tous-C9LFEB]|nr:MAG: hypothetical protein B9S32_00290 [Verrucomicrobia bacterium Tous-C9LFEB]
MGAASVSLAASGSNPDVSMLKLQSDGAFVFDGVLFSVAHFDSTWKRTEQTALRPDPAAAPGTNGEWKFAGPMVTPASAQPITLKETLQRASDRSLRVSYVADHASGVPAENFCLDLMVPVNYMAGNPVRVDEQSVDMPTQFKDVQLVVKAAKTLVLPTATGTLTIKGISRVLIQDNRKWGFGYFEVRLEFPRPKGPLQHAELAVDVTYAPYASAAISLASVTNRAFADDKANDGQGGWSDEGSGNDLSPLPLGPLAAAGVTFDIIDPAKNRGTSCLVISQSKTHSTLTQATVPVAGSPTYAHLYLLHATAWTPGGSAVIGKVTTTYTDGSKSVQEIKTYREVGNWWSPSAMPNGAVGWSGTNKSAPVGLYVSHIAVEKKPIREITLESTGPTAWLIAGLSGSMDYIRFDTPPAGEFQLAEGPDWKPYSYALEIKPGSVFDFSHLNDAPAGKYGPIRITSAGHFEFEKKPGDPVRFYGVNLCFSANYLSKEQADRVADLLSRSGYNVVRFHHYDGDLLKKGGSSYEFDPVKLDQLDYFFAALKARGIYINIDLYTFRKFSPTEIPDLGKEIGAKEIKALMPISDRAVEVFNLFAKNLLTHVNPYTKMTWASDPALVGICPVNEVSLLEFPENFKELSALYEQAFAKWLATQPPAIAKDRPAAIMRFCVEIQQKLDVKLRTYLKSLGVVAPITGSNWKTAQMLSYLREDYEYVDNHMYWDHPEFTEKQWSLPFRFAQTSATTYSAGVPRGLFASRMLGKPYIISEFNYVCPNAYRAEGGLLMSAYASLQDWDGLYNFDYATTIEQLTESKRAGTFDLAVDPIGLLADRFGALIFRRRDIEPARKTIGFVMTSEAVYAAGQSRAKEFSRNYTMLGLISRIGVAATGADAKRPRAKADAFVMDTPKPGFYDAEADLTDSLMKDGILPATSYQAGQGYQSDTGQILLNTEKGTLKVVTDRMEGFVLSADAELSGKIVSVANDANFGTLYVVSVDGKPLAQSDRILMLHLTDSLNSQIRFADATRRLLLHYGSLPHLVRRGSVDVKFKLADVGKKTWKVWQVNPMGERVKEQSLQVQGGDLTLHLETVLENETCLAYELVRD